MLICPHNSDLTSNLNHQVYQSNSLHLFEVSHGLELACLEQRVLLHQLNITLHHIRAQMLEAIDRLPSEKFSVRIDSAFALLNRAYSLSKKSLSLA
jgi:hypothetical protein